MADPITLSIIAATTAIAGGVAGWQAGEQEAAVAKQNMIAAQREGTVAAQIEGMKSRAAVGRATALAAASGFTVDGSATDVIGALAARGSYNVDEAIYQGRRRVAQAAEDRRAARRRGRAAVVQAVGQGATALTMGLGGAPAGGLDANGNAVAGGL